MISNRHGPQIAETLIQVAGFAGANEVQSDEANMTITSDLFEAYLECPTKCFLRSLGETGVGNPYADWVQAQSNSYREVAIARLKDGIANNDCVTGSLDRTALKSAKWHLAADTKVCGSGIESSIHAVERVPSQGRGEPAHFIPVRFIFTNKLTRHDRLLLGFDSTVLSEALGRDVELGKIIHGDDFVTLRVNTSALDGEARKTTAKIAALLSAQEPPDLVLNRHCSECEFQTKCRKKAIETDDLSLLAGMKEDERNRFRSKGIFTVKQLSYTFRPRRTPKRTKNPARPRYPALQALAIRENTGYVHGNPCIPDSKTRVHLDIERLPDSGSYYLIGALIVSEGHEAFHSFWASEVSEEPEQFVQFVDLVLNLADFRILHLGDYEAVALRRMKARLPETLHSKISFAHQLCILVATGIDSRLRFIRHPYAHCAPSGAD